MCYNPRVLSSGMVVECGHCQACLKKYQDMWIARLSEEAKSWRSVNGFAPIIFFTLKYRNEDIPCRYLVCTDFGYRFQDTKPDCTIYPFWTQIKEGSKNWKERKESLLKMYFDWFNHTASDLNYDRVLTVENVDDRQLIREERYDMRYRVGFGPAAVYSEDLPDGYSFHECGMQVAPFDAPGLFAFEFHTVRKSDVQNWMKRGRIRLQRSLPEIFDQEYNPRFSPDWYDYEGNVHRLPSCSVPKNVKFFITSEYGPQTFRPHLHGCMFGITYDEFQKYFAEDWQETFGDIEFSVYDSSRGAFSYVSKYCSKGGYEHPYCAKDFFYPSGLEYHSKHYEACLRDFGLDMPMVEPTFHLISKGLGVSYAFRSEIMSYFGVRLQEYLTKSGRLRYTSSDIHDLPLPSLNLMDATFAKCSHSVKLIPVKDGTIIRKFTQTGLLVGESLLKHDAVIDCLKENSEISKQYHRVYVKSNHLPQCGAGGVRASRIHPAWHLIGHSVCGVETKETCISLPRYYRQWLVSPLASALRVSAAARLYPSPYECLSGEISEPGHEDEFMAALQQIMDSEAFEKYSTCTRLRKSAERFYLRSSGIEELD